MDVKAEKIQFGSYPQSVSFIKEPITWINVAADYENKICLFMSEKILLPWITEKDSWEKSRLRNYLNNEFLNEAFSDEERRLLKQIESGENGMMKIYTLSTKCYESPQMHMKLYDKVMLPTLTTILQDNNLDNALLLKNNIPDAEPTYLCKSIHFLNQFLKEIPRFVSQTILEIEVKYWILADRIMNTDNEVCPLYCLKNAFMNPYKMTVHSLKTVGVRPCIMLNTNFVNEIT